MAHPSPTLRRYLLAASAPPLKRDPKRPRVRRLRLAPLQPQERFAHLRRSYD